MPRAGPQKHAGQLGNCLERGTPRSDENQPAAQRPLAGQGSADAIGAVLPAEPTPDSFAWQEIDEGILPALYAAVSPDAESGAYYGPRGLLEMAGGGVTLATVPRHAKNEADCRRLWERSEQLTGVTYPKPD